MKKKLLAFVLLFILICSLFSVPVSAQERNLVINDLLVRKASWQLATITTIREFLTDGSMKISGVEGANYFKAEKYKDFEVHTRAKFELNKDNWNWAGYALRTKYNTVMPSDATNSGYMVIVSFQSIVVHKYDRGTDTILETLPTDYFFNNKIKDIYVGISDVADGVRIYFIVDNSMIIDVVDKVNPLRETGYFGTLAYLNAVHTVIPIKGYVSKVTPENESITDNPSAGDGPLYIFIALAALSVVGFVIPKRRRKLAILK